MDRQELFDKQKALCKKHGLVLKEVDYALSVLKYIDQAKLSDANFYKGEIKNDTPTLWQIAHGLRKEEKDARD